MSRDPRKIGSSRFGPDLADARHFGVSDAARRKVSVIASETPNLFIALDKAFVMNAVKHNSKFDSARARFASARTFRPTRRALRSKTEGDGFDVSEIPDTLDPVNLFEPQGWRVFYYNIMDEVSYNDRGNRLTMVKRPGTPLTHNSPAFTLFISGLICSSVGSFGSPVRSGKPFLFHL
ncbi:MAG: ATP-binding protein [Acidobacteria bacterium]|nr:ATP-binding protein [Acidobacteriota bacterium]